MKTASENIFESNNRRGACARRRGFTFVELCMALLVCSMVFAAVSAFAMAMGRSWQMTDAMQSGSLRASQIALRLQTELRGCDAVLYCNPGSLTNTGGGSAEILLWKNDAFDPSSGMPDGQIEYTECTLITYEPPNGTTPGTIYVYHPYALSTDPAIPTSLASDPGGIPAFKARCTRTPLATNVDGMAFSVQGATSGSQNALVEFQLSFVGDGQTAPKVRYGAVALRAPTTPPGT
jgi:hypothetical protein